MPASDKATELRKVPALEMFVGKYSLLLAAFGQSFFYLHLFKPGLPVWIAGPFFMLPWGILYVLFFHERPLVSARTLRGCWILAAGASALFTVMAEMTWLSGLVPPWAASNPYISVALLQGLMNCVWLSFIPMVHDYLRNPHLWP